MKEINAVALGSQVYPAVPGSGSTAGTLKGKQSFESFLNIGSSAGTSGVKAGNTSAKQADTVSSANADTTQPGNTVQTADTATNQQQTDAAQAGQEDMDSSVTQTTDADMDSSGISETVNAVNNAVKEAVKSITGLDDEALAEIMSVLGMSFTDLFDMDNLKQFIMYINNTSDATDLLMNESMMSQLNNLADIIADIDIEAITGMPESDFAQLLQNLADGNMPVADNNPDGMLQEPGVQQQDTQTGDIPVTVEYVSEEDEPVVTKETVQTTVVTKEAGSQKELAVQEEDNTENGNLQAGKGTKESVNQAGQQEGLKQGTDSQTGGTLTEGANAEVKPAHEETFNSQAGFIQNLAQAAADVQENAMPQQARMQTMINIVNQVVEQIKVTMGKEVTNMQLQLNPESLGKVLISVTANHGVMTANFTVQSEEAKEALQSQMFSLREALESRNLKVDAVEVEVSDFTFSQSNQADAQNQKEFEKGSGRRFRFDDGGSDEEDGADVIVSGKQNTQKLDMGSSIDFTA